MFDIETPKIECVECNDNGTYGKYVVAPLERGYGTTLGNSLRRILLSSLPGVATTSIKIDGVLHEFSTIKGVKEDVTEIILNIKELALRMDEEGSKVLHLDVKGSKVVKAGDIQVEDGIEIINKDLHDQFGDFIVEGTAENNRGLVLKPVNSSSGGGCGSCGGGC